MHDPYARSVLDPTDTFARRHLGSTDAEIADMLATLGARSMGELIDQTLPASIRLDRPL